MGNFDVFIYTDGAARGNPGPGGYGIVMEWVGKPYKKEFSQGYHHTTNNRMELLAVIEALRKLKKNNLNIKIFTDSKYVVDAITKGWVFNWQRTNFKGKKNEDLWKDFLALYPKHHLSFQWIKGHNNHPQNERCDQLAVEASKKPKLLVDDGFEKS
ncbi:ribonuclease HI [Zhouia sp. PK063]|uniref:ribonuclease HI n=1 Tax=Zhouia sp. PK063 TaxID=3373602 RepID=UPI0037917363